MSKMKILVIPTILKSLKETYGKVDIKSTSIGYAERKGCTHIEVRHTDYSTSSIYTLEEIKDPSIRKQGKKNGEPFESKFPGSPPYYLHCMPWKGNGVIKDIPEVETIYL